MDDNVWIYSVYDLMTPSDQFGAFSPLVKLWKSKFMDSQFPQWRDFELLDFAGWYGQLSLIQITYDPLKLTHILWGTALTQWWGKDYTNKTMSDDSPAAAEVLKDVEGPYVRKLIDSGGMGLCSGRLILEKREFIHVTYVDLPLMYDDALSRVMSVYALDVPRDSLLLDNPLYEAIEPY